MTNFEGIVNQWLNTPMFDGNTAFSFNCPMTRQPTSLVKDQGESAIIFSPTPTSPPPAAGITAFMQRIGGALGLDTLPSFHFRYSRYDAEDETDANDILEWGVYSTADQLTLMAKVVLMYQHREAEPSFTAVIKENHLITFYCKRVVPIDPLLVASQRYRVSMTLNVLTSHLRTHNRTPHALTFVVTRGTQTPFPDFDFVWVSPAV